MRAARAAFALALLSGARTTAAQPTFAAGAAAQAAVSDDGETWLGFGATLCGYWRSICIGPRVDVMVERERDAQPYVERRDVGVLALGTKSAPVGPGHLALDVGLGLGLTPTRLALGAGYARTSVSPRVALAVRAALPLAAGLWLDLRAGVMVNVLAPRATVPVMLTEEVLLPGDPLVRAELAVGLRIGMP